MSTTVTYKGDTLTTVNNATKTLKTAGKYMEGDVILTDNSEPSLQAKTTTPTESQQTIEPDSGYDGLSQVTVNPIPSQYIIPTGTKSITENGTGIDVAQYASVDVAVQSGDCTRTEIVPSQTVTPDSSRTANFTATTLFVDGEYYVVTYDGTEYVVTAETLWTDNVILGDAQMVWQTTDVLYPFALITTSTESEGYFVNTSTHTIKVELLEFTGDATILSSKSITANGTYNASSDNADGYANVTVNVPSTTPSLQSKSVSYTPSETAQSATVTADSGYDGLSSVDVSVGAISPTYVGSGITRRSSNDITNSLPSGYYRVIAPAGYYESAATKDIAMRTLPTPVISIDDATGVITASATLANSGFINPTTTTATEQLTLRSSTDLTASGATVTVPAGYYSAQASKAVASGTEGTPTATKGTVSSHSVTVTPSVTNTAGYISGGTKTGTAVTVSASELVSGTVTISASGTTDVTNYASASVAAGGATAPSSITGTTAAITTGTNTLTLTKTVSITPSVTAGYISTGTEGNSSVSLTASVPTKAAATITPSTSNQTIAAGTYLTGAQTIAGDADLIASNIISTANIFGVQGSVVVQNYYTGTSEPSSSLGINGDLYFQTKE